MINKTGLLVFFCLELLAIPFSCGAKFSVDVSNKERLQRGAQLYMNYCSGCHSLKYLRYNRMAEDLGLTGFGTAVNKTLINHLIFTSAAVYDPIQIAMPLYDAKQWFGVVPPDLSLSAREKGANWLYSFLKNFYSDSSRPFGVNNLLIPNVAMPNVLEPIMGQQVLITKNNNRTVSLVRQDDKDPSEFEGILRDLVTFLVYVSEPAQLIRYQLGIVVLAFLGLLFIVVYCLKEIYWRRLKDKNK